MLTADSETTTADHLPPPTGRGTSVCASSGYLQRVVPMELQAHLPFR